MGKSEEFKTDNEVDIDLSKYTRDKGGYIDISEYFTISKFKDIDLYESELERLISKIPNYLSESRDTLREIYVTYKFNENDKLRQMNYLRFIYNLIMWRPYLKFDVELDKKAIFNAEIFHNVKHNAYFNNFSDKHRDLFTMGEYSKELNSCQIFMTKIVTTVGGLLGNSMSVYDMVQMAKRNKEIAAIFYTQIDLENFKVNEAEEFLIGQTERLFQILLTEDDEFNPLKPLIRAGVGVSRHQVQESYVHNSFKPDLAGSTIPVTDNSNLLTYGVRKPETVYVDSAGKLLAPSKRKLLVA